MMKESNEKIDVHRARQNYVAALARLERDTSICPENKAHILEYLRACSLGKTVFSKQKKRIREKRLLKYIYTLQRISHWLGNKDFKAVGQAEMEAFIAALEENRLTIQRNGEAVALLYAEWSRRDIKVCLKKFYKWLLGEGRAFPELVAWIDTHIGKSAPPSLSLEEIRTCAEYTARIRGKAIIWVLFESGARAEEFLNVRISHVEDKGSHFVARIEYPKTFKRSLPIYEGAKYLREWLKEHPRKGNAEAQLFPISYEALLKFLKRLGQRALGKRITPQLMRDSFATWLASKKVGRYQMCKLMGWAMSSDMPDRYIDRLGLVEEETIQGIRGDELSKVERENVELRATLNRLEGQYNQLQEKDNQRAQVDAFLSALLKDEEVRKTLVARVKKAGLQKMLLSV